MHHPTTRSEEQVTVLANLLAAAHHVGLPQPDVITIRDGIVRLGFNREVTDMREWASWCGVDTHTLQSADNPDAVIELFDTDVQGVDFRGLAMYPRLSLVGA